MYIDNYRYCHTISDVDSVNDVEIINSIKTIEINRKLSILIGKNQIDEYVYELPEVTFVRLLKFY